MVSIRNNQTRAFYAAVDAALLLRRGVKLDAEQKAALAAHKIDADWSELDLAAPRFRNALSSEVGTRGQFNVPEGFLAGWEIGQSALNVVRNFATIHSVVHGGQWRLPTVTGPTLEGEMLPEGTSGNASDVTFGGRVFSLRKFLSRPTRVANELEADAPNFAEQLGRVLGEQVARIQNRKFTIGSGAGEPSGIVPTATPVSAVSATAMSSDDLLALLAAVGGSWLDPGGSAFMCSQAIFVNAILKMKTGDGTPIFSNGRVFDYRVIVNNHMSSTIAAGEKTVVFGRLDRFHICEAPIRLQAIREVAADLDQTVFRAVQRADAGIVDAADTPFVALTH